MNKNVSVMSCHRLTFISSLFPVTKHERRTQDFFASFFCSSVASLLVPIIEIWGGCYSYSPLVIFLVFCTARNHWRKNGLPSDNGEQSDRCLPSGMYHKKTTRVHLYKQNSRPRNFSRSTSFMHALTSLPDRRRLACGTEKSSFHRHTDVKVAFPPPFFFFHDLCVVR